MFLLLLVLTEGTWREIESLCIRFELDIVQSVPDSTLFDCTAVD